MIDFTENDVKKYDRKNNTLLAYGSEGTVYKFEKYAVKLFKKVKGNEFMKLKEEKVKTLLTHEIEGFIKPEGIVYDNEGIFSGYAMPYIENNGDVADVCYKNGDNYSLDQKIEYLLKVESLIKKAHKLGIILNDVAIWNFLVLDNKNVLGVDIDNFQIKHLKSETEPLYYLPYYQGLCQNKGYNMNSDKFSFGLFTLNALMKYPFNNEGLENYDEKSNYLKIHISKLDVSEEVKDELYQLISTNPEKEWIGKTLQKVSSSGRKYINN